MSNKNNALTPVTAFIIASIITIIIYGIFELFSIGLVVVRYQTLLSPNSFFDLFVDLKTFGADQTKAKTPTCRSVLGSPENPNVMKKDPSGATTTNDHYLRYLNTLGPHPYLGYVRWRPPGPNCDGSAFGNNENLDGPDFPLFHDDSVFTVLMTGGSVANMLANQRDEKGRNYFEAYLNEHFLPPHGSRFLVLNGALGDYRTPQNVFALVLYHDLIDGLIDLSGYNESHNYFGNKRIESPSPNYYGLFDLEIESEIEQRKSEIRRWIEFGRESFFCRHSYSCVVLLQLRVTDAFNQLERYKTEHTPRYFEHEKQFVYPATINAKQANNHRRAKHKSYVKLMQAICKESKINCSFFLQPIPQIGKTLTETERLKIIADTKERASQYRKIIDDLLTLKSEGVDISSLDRVFANETQTIYSDHIHFAADQADPVGRGSRLVTHAIGASIAKSWGLKIRPAHSAN